MELLSDEHVRLRLTPHLMTQIKEYPLWIWILILSILSIINPKMVFIYGDLIFETQIYVNNVYYYLASIHFWFRFIC